MDSDNANAQAGAFVMALIGLILPELIVAATGNPPIGQILISVVVIFLGIMLAWILVRNRSWMHLMLSFGFCASVLTPDSWATGMMFATCFFALFATDLNFEDGQMMA